MLMTATSWRFTWHYALSQLRLKYRHTMLGFLWNFLEPAIYLVVLSVVFSVINRMNISDYAVFMFSALVPWRYFEKIVNSCTDSITGGEWLLKKMHVSPLTFPITRWTIATVEFGFSLAVMLLVFLFLKDSWTAHIAVLPLIVIPWAMLGLGCGMICAVLFTFFRDIRPIVQLALMLLFFSAPILFSPNLFDSASLQGTLMRFHPITYYAALFQKPFYEGIWPGGMDWLVSCGLGALSVLVGILLIKRYQGKFYYYL